MPDLDPHDLESRLKRLTATYEPAGRPAFDDLLSRARRRRRTRLAGALVALAAVASVPTLVLPALHDRSDQTLAAAGSDGAGLCPDAAARYAAWARSRAGGGLDLRRLQRYEVSASYAPPLGTLQAARAAAVRIVSGTVTDVRFDDHGSLVTVRVDRTVKGPPSGDLVLRTGNGLTPAHEELEYASKDAAVRRTATPRAVQVPASLSNDATAPLLLPGERAVWLLQPDSGSLRVEAFTGQYASCGGRVTATDGNPFAAQVDGLGEQELLARLGQ